MKKLIWALSAGVLILGSCAHKSNSGKEAEENYRKALEDSISNVTTAIDSCNNVALDLADKVNNLLPEFRVIDKSKEVEYYSIFQGWENRYPLQSTGVVARLGASRQLELVAVLKGGVFDQIRVNAPSTVAESEVVANDQALNYRRGDLTTVLFTGAKADSIASLIADNELNPITVTFLNGGKATGSWNVGNDYSKMISMTYLLYSSHQQQVVLEKKAYMLGEKLKVLRRHLEEMKEKGVKTDSVK